MPRNQDAVLLFMGSVDCPCFPTALGLIDLLEEMDKYGSLRTATDVFFWAKLQWRRKGITRESLTAAYLEFKQNDIRGKAREKKRRQRLSPEVSPEKGDKLGDNVGDNSGDKTGEMSPEMSPEKGDNAGDSLPSPSSPSPAPFLPPSPPAPPVTPYNPPNPNPNSPTSSSAARGEPTAATADRPDFNTIEAYASANLDYLSPYNMQDLVDFCADLGDALVRHAIDEACANSKRSWAYVRSILLRYQRSGFKTVGEVRADADRRSLQKTSSGCNNPALNYTQRSSEDTNYSNCIIDLNAYCEEESS